MTGSREVGDPALGEKTPSLERSPSEHRARAPDSSPQGRFKGDRIGRYEIDGELGAGGMSVVYAAIDTVLGRRVALKLVRPGSSGNDGAIRLLREAQSLARLSHPNVVSVFDVGTTGDDVYIAIELVDGESLRTWAASTRSPAQILEVMRAAGRGLAAAHAAGVVHRDVKPDNVLVGNDGIVRISDFGLARAAGAAHEATAPALVLTTELTRTGAVMGTPAYMAPEQIDGAVATEAADQFSYCVTLFELLFGARPFAGDSVDALRAAIAAQAIAAPAGKLPAVMVTAIRRGLREAAAERHPSMQALLDELAPPRRRRWWAVAAAGAAIAAAVIATSASRADDDPCRTGEAELADAWTPARRAVGLARIAGLGAYGRTLAQGIDEPLRDHAARWTAGHREACLATRRGTQPTALLDRRWACLARSRAALAEVARIVESADARALSEVALAVRAHPDPAACADSDALVTDVAPPPPAIAARVSELTEQLARARVQLAAGRFAQARTAARATVDQVRALGYQAALAEALLVEGHAALAMEQLAEAVPPLTEAVSIAFAVGADAIGIEAWARRAFARGSLTGPTTALAGLDVVEAIATRRPAARFARALLYNNVGAVEGFAKHRDRAVVAYQRALSEARGVTGPGAIELLVIRTNLALAMDDPVRRDAVYAEVDAELTRLLGEDHPETLRGRGIRAAMQVSAPAAADLLAAVCGRHDLHDAGSLATQCWAELGFIAGDLHDDARARDALRRALGTGVDAPPWVGPYLALWQGDAPHAIEQLVAALAAQPPQRPDEPWWESFARAELQLGLGRARRAAGELHAARQVLTTSVATMTAVARDHPLPQIERRLARGRAELAITLARSGGPPTEIVELARAALAWLERAGSPPHEIEQLQRLATPR